jgi:Arc/MetJ-type ribon-helix-helix transcriptional regulator
MGERVLKKINENSEKITINVNHIDLGKIDLLVDNGFFSNRSDFIRTAIRNELNKKEAYVEEKIDKNGFVLGIVKYSVEDFEKAIETNQLFNYTIIGLVIIDSKVSLDMVKQSVKKLDVKGTLIASKEIKDYLKDL